MSMTGCVPPKEPGEDCAAISWTGGKDSTLSMYLAKEAGYKVDLLVTFVPKQKPGMPKKSFKAHALEVMKLQAESLGCQHEELVIGGGDFKMEYTCRMNELCEMGYGALVSGDIDYVGSMDYNWLRRCAEACSRELQVLTPLWQWNRASVLEKLIEKGFKVVFTCVKEPWFGKEWVGRVIDQETLQELQSMLLQHPGFDIAGENGEYHTMTLGGPGFQREIIIADFIPEKVPMKERGAPEGDMHVWWYMKINKAHLDVVHEQ